MTSNTFSYDEKKSESVADITIATLTSHSHQFGKGGWTSGTISPNSAILQLYRSKAINQGPLKLDTVIGILQRICALDNWKKSYTLSMKVVLKIELRVDQVY